MLYYKHCADEVFLRSAFKFYNVQYYLISCVLLKFLGIFYQANSMLGLTYARNLGDEPKKQENILFF